MEASMNNFYVCIYQKYIYTYKQYLDTFLQIKAKYL